MSGRNLRLTALVLFALIGSFFATAQIADMYLQQSEPGPAEPVFQQFSAEPVSVLMDEAAEFWKQKKFSEAYQRYVTVYQTASPRSSARRISALRLAAAYHAGKGTKKDLHRAFYYLRIDELKDHPYALYRAGLIMMDSKYREHDIKQAKRFLTRASALDVKAADVALSKLK